MQKFQDYIFSSPSVGLPRPVPNATVLVLNYPAMTVATIYSDNGITTTANPFLSAGDGKIAFYAADGHYSIQVSGQGINGTPTTNDILLEDAPADFVTLAQLAASSGSSLVGFSHAVTYAQGTVGLALQSAINVKNAPYNAVGDGITDDTAAINSAFSAAVTGGQLIFPPGAYLISSKLTLDKRIKLVFEGGNFVGAGEYAGSYLIKKSTMSTSAVDITASGVVWEGGGVLGQVGNTGDGIVVLSNNVMLDSVGALSCGQDGIRIGSDSGVNANTFTLIKPVCYGNSRHGLYIHDSSVNANAGVVTLPFCQGNGADGIKIGTARWNNIIGPLVESNTGWGIHCATGCIRNVFVGGDTDELNIAGNIILDAGSQSNHFFGTDYTPASLTDNGTANMFVGQRAFIIPVTITASGNVITTGSTTALSLATSGGTQAKIIDKALAVNFVQLQGGATLGNVSIYPEGTDTNIGVTHSTKGTGTHDFYTDTGGALQFQVLRTASATRRVTVTGSNGGNPTIGASAGNLAITPTVIAASAVCTGRSAPVYGASVAINAFVGNVFSIVATNGTAFTVANPTNATSGQLIRVRIKNTSGGALGLLTWDTLYKLGAAWAQPATGFSRTIDFDYDGTNWIEANRSAADVAN